METVTNVKTILVKNRIRTTISLWCVCLVTEDFQKKRIKINIMERSIERI